MDEQNLTELVTEVVFQLAIILLAAKVAGEICSRYLKIAPVLGELAAGVIIGPFALGGLDIGPLGPLFHVPASARLNPFDAVPTEIYVLGQIAAVVLLFVAGLETNLRLFVRFAGPASLVALGGVALPFFFGVLTTVLLGYADGPLDPVALFMGAIMTATSVGITARVLSDLGRLGSPEGTTIIAAAVLDDVLGILVLTVVVALSATGEISAGSLGVVAAKAFGFWVGLTGITFLASRWIHGALTGFHLPGATLALALVLAFVGAALAETAGLAMIIGAYSVGLALSTTPLLQRIEESLMGVYHALVPIFFVTMGMLVDVTTMTSALTFGLILTGLAIVSKVVGCGIPAWVSGFTLRGSWRVGLGMLPRGEVALIIAGVGLVHGVIDSTVFGVAVMMTVVTTLVAPIFLVPAFRSPEPGTRRPFVSSSQAKEAHGSDG